MLYIKLLGYWKIGSGKWEFKYIYIVVNLCDAQENLTKIIYIYFIIKWYEIEIMFETEKKKKKKIELKIDNRISIFAKMVIFKMLSPLKYIYTRPNP